MMHSCAVLCCAVLCWCCAVLCYAVLCCAVLPRQAKPSLCGLQDTRMLLHLKQYINPYTVYCATRPADGAAFKAANMCFCCLTLLQQFAVLSFAQ